MADTTAPEIEVRITQDDRTAILELIYSGDSLVNPSFSLQTSASLAGASYSSTQLGTSGSLSTQVSSSNGNLTVNASGSALGTFADGATLLIIELNVSAAGSITVNSASGNINGSSASVDSPPRFDLLEPSAEVVNFVQGDFQQGDIVFVNTALLPDWSSFSSESSSTYQWFRDGLEIAGATSRTYMLTQEDVETQISSVVEYRDQNFDRRSILSLESEPVENRNDDPTGEIGIAGPFFPEEILTVDTSALDDLDGLGTFGNATVWRLLAQHQRLIH